MYVPSYSHVTIITYYILYDNLIHITDYNKCNKFFDIKLYTRYIIMA